MKYSLSLALAALAIAPTTLAAPGNGWGNWNGNNWKNGNGYKNGNGWGNWNHGNNGNNGKCTPEKQLVRKDFDTMAPAERKAYTDAIKCMRSQPSNLDPNMYPAATDRYMDYAIVHVNQTKTVHLDAFFLTWHRYFLHLFEQDLRNICGYKGSFPYWNYPATVDDLTGSTIFNGDEYSMSGDGVFTNDDPIVLAPTFSLPHGSGGGCVKSGPFKDWTTTMQNIPIAIILQGAPLPPTAFQLNTSCLTRDLNGYVGQKYCNYDAKAAAIASPDIASFSQVINGVLGGTSLGIHSGAHFTMGAPASSLFVSPMDPIWYPLHAMLDNIYSQWQAQHPEQARDVFGTMTAANIPPTPNATIDSVQPDWGYLEPGPLTIGDLISITDGPFCYRYENAD